MSVRILHTGDLHIGMKFSSYPAEVRAELAEARFRTLERIIDKANDLSVDLLVISGDLFNSIQIKKKDTIRVVDILNEFKGQCMLILPGNHDYDNGAIDLWKTFKDVKRDHLLLLNEERPYHLKDYGLDIVVYPAPCHSKHSGENGLGWIKEQAFSSEASYSIGVAHGAIEGLSPDLEGNYYYMTMRELNSIPVDLWLLGHTHVSYPTNARIECHRIYNSGTPEPDGLNYQDSGSAWMIDISKDRILAEKVVTGEYRFFDEVFTVSNEEDLNDILNWIIENNPKKMVLRLNLNGSIQKEVYEGISGFYKKLESMVFYLIIEDANLKIKITKDVIADKFPKGSFPYEFLNGLSHDEEALQIAYELLDKEAGNAN
jgi:exonuclease SbcD